MPTLWKLPDIQQLTEPKQIFITPLEPLGNLPDVTNKLLSIPRIKPFFDSRIGYASVMWEARELTISYKEEPEFGLESVFSLDMERIEFERDYFKLYVQLFESLGCILLHEKNFIAPKVFRRML